MALIFLPLMGDFKKIKPISSYTSHAPIFIHNNSEFHSIATANGWLGDGLSAATPYLINDYSIVNDGYELISIEDTSLYFKIQNCYLDNVKGGSDLDAIYLRNVQNGIISNNIIMNNRHGIFLDTGCADITIEYNNIDDTTQSGIRIKGSNSVNVFNNTISNCIYHAIWLTGTTNSFIDENEAFLCYNGIWIREDSILNTVENNVIYDVTNGIWITNSSNNCSTRFNLITQSEYGIVIGDETANTEITNNTILGCTDYGVAIDGTSTDNVIMNNSFVNNKVGWASQAGDNGTLNTFDLNYWDDWTTPDVDTNGIVDTPYSINGTTMNTDPRPRTTPATPIGVHLLTPASFIFPLADDSVNETILIEWNPAYDSLAHDILYNISYKVNISSWVPIGEEIADTSINWNTSECIDGSGYQLRIISYCTGGLETLTLSGLLTIYHTPIEDIHFLTPTSFIFPLIDDIVNETILIQWNPAVDSLGHMVFYNISYRHNISTWVSIGEGLTGTNVFWNTSKTVDGSGYQIQIIAYCTNGLVDIIYSELFTVEHTDVDNGDGGPDPKYPFIWYYVIGGVAGVTIAGLSVGIVVVKKRKSRGGKEPEPVTIPKSKTGTNTKSESKPEAKPVTKQEVKQELESKHKPEVKPLPDTKPEPDIKK